MEASGYQTLCVVNPKSANGRTRKAWSNIERALVNRNIEIDVQYTRGPGDATLITRKALQSGYNRIVSVGGDGTLNEVVNGFFDKNQHHINPEACLSFVPLGTGGDFARMFNMNRDIDTIFRLFTDPQVCRCDLVLATYTGWQEMEERRFYINEADVGLGSATVYRVNNNSKALGGFLSFLLAFLYTIFTYQNLDLVIKVDGETRYEGKTGIIVVGNGSYFGGGVKVAPQARIDDGLLEIILAKDLRKRDLLANLTNMYKGTHMKHPLVERMAGHQVQIMSANDILFEMDGETPGHGNQVTFEIVPAAMKLLV
ncbi:MAG TPA: diacylglycerol kinase family lipid kinase [Syntrophomonadaceae bacterium]|nr:diacylglycerol kinase family lipid kinase [Syntrophomonadaceae bacterium]HQA06993.1 diacylglycerol kinase family lipid kinase [Syntrophomonadaceae bacterium]HQE23872.1 diacylglycerol kinase family lipid kinase [Syntrophomonadaceae bacterium]